MKACRLPLLFAVSILIITELHLEESIEERDNIINMMFQSLLSRNYISKNDFIQLSNSTPGGFNPYYHGTTSRRFDGISSWLDKFRCFNPYYHGTTSRSGGTAEDIATDLGFQSLLSRNYISKLP